MEQCRLCGGSTDQVFTSQIMNRYKIDITNVNAADHCKRTLLFGLQRHTQVEIWHGAT